MDDTAQKSFSDMLFDAGLSLDRLPMLHVIFDRVATTCADAMRHLAASQSYYSLSNVESGRIGDILEAYEANGIAGVFHAPEWDTHIIIGLDRDFVFTLVEVLFGADGSEPPIDEERPFSNIETQVARRVLELVGEMLSAAFAMAAKVHFSLERLETRMDFAVVGRHKNQAVVAKFLLEAINRGGEMFVIIPQSALTSIRQQLARVVTGEHAVRDPAWMQQIQTEVKKAEIEVRAILEQRRITLGEIAEFRIGQVLNLQASPRTRILLEAREQGLFWCKLGQSEGLYSLCVEDVIDQEQEFLGDILSR